MRYKYKSCQKCALYRSSVDADHLKKMYFKHIINDNATATPSSIPSIASVQSQSSHVNTQSPENIPPLQHPLLHLPHNSLQGLPQPPLLLLCNLTDHLSGVLHPSILLPLLHVPALLLPPLVQSLWIFCLTQPNGIECTSPQPLILTPLASSSDA